MQAQIGGPLLNLATRRVGTGAYAYEFAMVNKTLVVSCMHGILAYILKGQGAGKLFLNMQLQRCCLPTARMCWGPPPPPHQLAAAMANAAAALDSRALCSHLPIPSAPEPAPCLQIDDTRSSGSYLEVQVPVYSTAGGPAGSACCMWHAEGAVNPAPCTLHAPAQRPALTCNDLQCACIQRA